MDETTTELTSRESWKLLGTTDVGRLAVCLGEAPDIFPINYVVANGTIIFRTAPGLKHVQARLHGLVAFETDGVDRESGIAWSVVVKGRARDITIQNELEFARSLPLRPMHTGAKPIFVRIEPDVVTGRRFPLAGDDRWVGSPAVSPAE
jgi:nitroimidazol reductase NimA-like FMN-containing flavoprotein (pyridoxamine 5'-phosphate oxidase superfamily)